MSTEPVLMPFGNGDEIEKNATKLVNEIYSGTADNSERVAINIVALAKRGPEERQALFDADAVQALGILCSRDNEARTQAHGALGLAAMASNFARYETK
jgi:hypothetical protein